LSVGPVEEVGLAETRSASTLPPPASTSFPFDALLVATGAGARAPLPGALTLLAPEPEFVYRPVTVAEAFELFGPEAARALKPLRAALGITLRCSSMPALTRVSPTALIRRPKRWSPPGRGSRGPRSAA
jgi:hypothetical protein